MIDEDHVGRCWVRSGESLPDKGSRRAGQNVLMLPVLLKKKRGDSHGKIGILRHRIGNRFLNAADDGTTVSQKKRKNANRTIPGGRFIRQPIGKEARGSPAEFVDRDPVGVREGGGFDLLASAPEKIIRNAP